MILSWYLDTWGEQKDIIIIFFLILFVNYNVKQINTSQIVQSILTIKYDSDVFYSSTPKRFEQNLQLQRIKVLK